MKFLNSFVLVAFPATSARASQVEKTVACQRDGAPLEGASVYGGAVPGKRPAGQAFFAVRFK